MPFAIYTPTNRVIGIRQAERGKQCNCHCLSCGTPVQARQGEVNQWHFGHRTDTTHTSKECDFSPVTAIALIIRQELHQLTQLNVGKWTLSNIEWQTDVVKHDFKCDAYAEDSNSKLSVAMQIPFANGRTESVNSVPSDIDIVLRVHTHLMADSLYAAKNNQEQYSSQDVFGLLIENWNKWVSIERTPDSHQHPSVFVQELETQSTTRQPPKEVIPSDERCVCCYSERGYHANGLFCKSCVRSYVGSKFNSISDMLRYYKK